MPVQIPSLERGPAPEPSTAGRIDESQTHVNTRYDDGRVRGALEQFATQGISTMHAIEQQEADSQASASVIKYETAWRKQIYGDPEAGTLGLKEQKGDPTKLYSQFDDSMSKTFNDISNDPSFSSYTKRVVQQKLADKAGLLDQQKLSMYGYQKGKYEDGLTQGQTQLEQKGLVENSGLVKPGDESSFSAMDKNVANIRQAWLDNGIKFGSVKPDESGNSLYVGDDGKPTKVSVGPGTLAAVNKHVSDGLVDAIKTQINAGNLDAADAIKERYKDFLDANSSAKLGKQFTEELKNKQATEAAFKVAGKPADEQEKYFATLEPEVRLKAEQKADDHARMMDNAQKRQSSTFSTQIMSHLQQVQNSDSPYTTRSQLEADPIFKSAIDKVTNTKQIDAIYSMVVQPKNTNPKALDKFHDLMTGADPEHPNGLTGLSGTDLQSYMSGMNKTDQAHYKSQWEKANDPSVVMLYKQQSRGMNLLKSEAFNSGIVTPDNDSRTGVVPGGSQSQRLGQLQDKFSKALSQMGNLSPQDLRDQVHEFLLDEAQGKVYSPPSKFQGQIPQRLNTGGNSVPPPSQNPLQGRVKALQDYTNSFGRQPSGPELDKFISDDKSGRYK